jgi:pimeloyl-ACP methyl ester carboxylesterase
MTHTLAVPGGRLSYQVRGSGPLLVLTGSPMAAAFFAPLADALADRWTVLTHDPRGIAGSVLDDPGQDSTPELRADDLVALLDAVGADTADVFGSSGGGVTGLALLARHPGRVRTLVAHEPPVLELLPDAAARQAEVDAVLRTFHAEGPGAALAHFLSVAGLDQGDGAPSEPAGPPSERDLADMRRFFEHELRPTARYRPDLDALRRAGQRLVVGIGVESGPSVVTNPASNRLATLLGLTPVAFPGGHGGFLTATAEFAKTLDSVLAAG